MLSATCKTLFFSMNKHKFNTRTQASTASHTGKKWDTRPTPPKLTPHTAGTMGPDRLANNHRMAFCWGWVRLKEEVPNMEHWQLETCGPLALRIFTPTWMGGDLPAQFAPMVASHVNIDRGSATLVQSEGGSPNFPRSLETSHFVCVPYFGQQVCKPSPNRGSHERRGKRSSLCGNFLLTTPLRGECLWRRPRRRT